MHLHFQPKQERLLDLLQATGPKVATVIGGGGAKGGGKSGGARNCAILLAMELGVKFPGVKITIVRRVYNDLKENHIDKIRMEHADMQPFWRAGDREFDVNAKGIRAKLTFAYAETKEDTRRKFLGGFESAIIIVDEAQQFDEEELMWIQAACRWTGRNGIPEGFCKLLLLFNPGGIGSLYIRRIFWTSEYKNKEQPHNYAFVHIFGWDNYEWFRGQVDISEHDFYEIDSKCNVEPADQEQCDCCRYHMFIYRTSEGRKYDAFPLSIRAGYLLGSFDHFEGQYYAGAWNEQKCVLGTRQVQEIVKPWWTRWMAQDWAFQEHAVHLWFVSGKMSPTEWMRHFGGYTDAAMDVCIIYREHVVSNRAEADLATDIVQRTPPAERVTVERFFLSQDAFGQRARQGGAHTIGEQFAAIMREHRLPAPEPADQDRVNGARFVYNCFRQAGLRGGNFDMERAAQGPAVFISTECPTAIENIPLAVRDERDPEDVMRVDGALWEDVTDSLRYGLKSMLDPQTKAPRSVRRQEVYDQYDQAFRTGSQMTALAMAMRTFDAEEDRGYKRVKRR